MLKNVSIKKKIYGFGILSTIFLIIIALFMLNNMNTIQKLEKSLVKLKILEIDFKQMEIDHLKWKAKVENSLLNSNVNNLEITTDPHKCGLGKWYYGEKKRNLVKLIPELENPLKKIEVPHQHLHESIDSLKKIFEESGEDNALSYFSDYIQKHVNIVINNLNNCNEILNKRQEELSLKIHKQEKSVHSMVIIVSIVMTLLLMAISTVIAQSILSPISKTVDLLKDISEGEGDLTRRLPDDNLNTEIGHLSKYFNLFVINIQSLVKQSKKNIAVIAKSSEEQSSVTAQVASSTEEMNSQSTTIASSTEEASANMTNISSSVEDMNASISTVATAIEEMSSTVNEISKSCQKELEIAEKANQKTETTNE